MLAENLKKPTEKNKQMAKPRIFISSTCFDLNDIRSELTSFLNTYNFEVLNSQLSNFGVSPDLHSHTACLEQVNNADYFIVIIGKRRGGTYIASEQSITNEEYKLAVKRGIPIMIFVDKMVDNNLVLYKKNPTMDFSTIVDDKRIFHFVEYIKSSSSNNWVFQYENINDIKNVINSQFSYYLLLFSQNIIKKKEKEKTIDSSKLTFVEFPSNIDEIISKKMEQEEETAFRNGLKELHNLIKNILSSEGNNDNKFEKIKSLWVIARYGELHWDNFGFDIDNNIFKDYAWSTTKGKRVFTQLGLFGAKGEYDIDEDEGKMTIRLSFDNQSDDCHISTSLKTIVDDLIAKFGAEEGLELFKKADFRLYMK